MFCDVFRGYGNGMEALNKLIPSRDNLGNKGSDRKSSTEAFAYENVMKKTLKINESEKEALFLKMRNRKWCGK